MTTDTGVRGASSDPVNALPMADLHPVAREGLLAAALGSIANAVMVTETDGTIVWVNAAFTAMSGYRAAEAVGSTPRILKSGRHDATHYAELWRTILSGRSWRGELVERHKDGHHYTVTQTVTPLLDEDGRITHFVAVHEDVTELRTSQARLRALFEHALDAIVLLDDEGRYIDGNPAACALIGYDVDELTTMSLADVVVASQLERLAHGWVRFLDDGRQRGSYTLRRRDGDVVEVEFQAVTDIVPGVHLAINRDVTAQRRAEADLRFHAQLLEATGDAVVATDLDGAVRYWNPAAERLYGRDQDEAVGRSIAELNLAPDMVGRAEEILTAVRSGRTWRGQFEVPRHDGSTLHALVTASPYRDASGQVAGIIGVSTDVTELISTRELLARRAAQQEALAELGRYSLQTGDLRAVGRAAETVIVEGLGGDRWHAAVVWDEQTCAELFGGSPTGVIRLDVAASGTILVWNGGRTDLPAQDLDFLRSVASILTVAQQRDAARAELQHLATHDELTGLPNRTLFLDRLEHTKAAAGRTGHRFAVLLLDLDGFKFVNDGLGHDVGDEVLCAIAARLRRVVRPTDTVARFGGDEFVVLCPGTYDQHVATAVARRLQGALAAPVRLDGAEVVVTASIGVAVGDAAADGSQLLRDADAAMYRAKGDGPDRIAMFEPDVEHRARHRLDLAAGLRRALDDDEIEAHYQPIIALETDRIVGVEALARWRRADGELVAPAEFIPLAEETGLIEPLGRRILEIACRDVRTWSDVTGGFIMSVNVSPRQFTRPGLTATVVRILRDSGLDPADLYLEITESALMSNHDVRTTLNELHEHGVRFAIDDFGTGYSSLSNLRRLPIDVLKIDRSFVSGLADDLQDRGLVASAVDLARTFGLTTIAEGIETPRQRTAAAALGCDLAQGYLWCPPVDAAAIAELVAVPGAETSTSRRR